MTGMLVEKAKGQAVERVKAVSRRIATEAHGWQTFQRRTSTGRPGRSWPKS